MDSHSRQIHVNTAKYYRCHRLTMIFNILMFSALRLRVIYVYNTLTNANNFRLNVIYISNKCEYFQERL